MLLVVWLHEALFPNHLLHSPPAGYTHVQEIHLMAIPLLKVLRVRAIKEVRPFKEHQAGLRRLHFGPNDECPRVHKPGIQKEKKHS